MREDAIQGSAGRCFLQKGQFKKKNSNLRKMISMDVFCRDAVAALWRNVAAVPLCKTVATLTTINPTLKANFARRKEKMANGYKRVLLSSKMIELWRMKESKRSISLRMNRKNLGQ